MDSTTPQTKPCAKCGESKPATTEHFGRDKHKPDGLHSPCKACERTYRATTKERKAARNRAYREAHRERHTERKRAYAAANKERVAEHDRVRHAGDKVCRAKYQRSYRAANRSFITALEQCRRARKISAEGTHTVPDIQAQYDRQKGRCYWCGAKVGEKYHVDHIVPLSCGGSDWPDNLVVACPALQHG